MRKHLQRKRGDACLVALRMVLAGGLVVMLGSFRAHAAADSDMPEVLRFAGRYHAETLRMPANSGRSGEGSKAAQVRALKEKLKATQ
ncbi:TPA: hypothetical protein O7120_004695, partial [Salmonella enterica]|nr:hypothetical protein [Salmonella enterica]